MVDWTKPIQTKDGRRAIYIGVGHDKKYPRLVEVDGKPLEWLVDRFMEDGRSLEDCNSLDDLENIPEKVELEICIYKDACGNYRAVENPSVYPATWKLVKTIKIEV